jgi:hypothetical protein
VDAGQKNRGVLENQVLFGGLRQRARSYIETHGQKRGPPRKGCRVYKTPPKAPGGFDFLEEEILPELEEFVYVKQISDPETFAEELGT